MTEFLRQLFLTWIVAATGTPEQAAYQTAMRWDVPQLVEPLIRICRRESAGYGTGHCKALGVHEGDAGNSRRVWRRAVERGLLNAWCQPYDHRQYSTRGAWGLMAAYNLHYLDMPCLPPWVLDVPVISAEIAARKLWKICSRPKHRRIRAARGWEGSDCRWMRRRCELAARTGRSTRGCRWVL